MAATKRKEVIVFIDGNNLYHNLKSSFIRPGSIDLHKLSKLVCERFNCNLKRSIYYNSVPSISDGQEVYYGHMKFLDQVKKYQNFEIKTRKLQRHSTQERMQIMQKEVSALGLCDVCKPVVLSHWKDYIGNINTKEKGIDILIAIDVMNLCLIKKECDACIIVSGDADFIPCMDILKSQGKWIATAMTAKGYSYELRKEHPYCILDKILLVDQCSKKK